MSLAVAAHGFAAALAGALAELGLTDAVVSPGSRNTPLTAAFGAHPGITDRSVHDERSAGFFALGLAKASGRPVALVCTSGTAAAEYHAAVAEADVSRVPLLALTADRPGWRRDVGAPQTIDQVKLYGDAVRWFHQGSVPGPSSAAGAPGLAAHAWAEATGMPPGPVHLNLPFDDDLVLAAGDAVPDRRSHPAPAVAAGSMVPDLATVVEVTALVGGRRTVAVVGALPAADAEAVAGLAANLRIPVLADPQSGLRGGNPGTVLASGDLLAAVGLLDRLAPEAVLRFGSTPTSKAVTTWLAASGDVPQVLVDPAGWRDPTASAALVVRADPFAFAAALASADPAPDEWAGSWHHADAVAQRAVEEAIGAEQFPNEPAIARTVAAAVPPAGILYASSSMPIRDLDAFAGPRPDSPVTVLANRGANGIDGVVSSALGAAASGVPVTALVGDVAALHDLNALATAARLDLPVTVVVVNNDGGGIFSFLPQADPARLDPGVFERHLATPHGVSLSAVAAALGMKVEQADTPAALADLVAAGTGPTLVELHTDRAANVTLHARLAQKVRAALR